MRSMLLVVVLGLTAGLACEERPPIGEPTNANTNTTGGGAGTGPVVQGMGGGTGGSGGAGGGGGTGGASGAGGGGGSAAVDMTTLEQQTMDRWNQAADAVPTSLDFHWTEWDQFPHPTYKGGTAQGYGEFANVLLAFFQSADNFDFLARNHLFTTPIVYIFPSGQSGLNTTFAALADYFSSPTAFGDISATTRAGLADVDARIKAAE